MFCRPKQCFNRSAADLVECVAALITVRKVIFDPEETVSNPDQPGMTGPDWLATYTATWVDDSGALNVKSKGFQVDFTDPRFERAPARFRGVHYCHFIAPEFFSRVAVSTGPWLMRLGAVRKTRILCAC